MAKKQKFDRDDPHALHGRHIYFDEKDRCIWYDDRKFIAYVIKPENVEKYRNLNNRYVLALVIFALVISFLEGVVYAPFIGIAGGLAAFIFLEVQFRTKFLTSLVKITNYTPKKEKPTMIASIALETKGRLLLKMALYIALAVTLVLLTTTKEFDTLSMVLIYAFAACSLGMCVISAIALNYQHKHSN